MKNKFILPALGLFMTSAFPLAAHADLTIAKDGKSTFTIVIPAKAPDSVRAAAQELQRDIAQATDANIPIRSESESITGNIVSLGSTFQAKSAGVTADGVADSGFRIVTKNGNLYIIGLDTVAKVNLSRKFYGDMTPQPDIPGPQYTKDGGWSNGTANGVYTFLEDYLGVRWLMPGELGLDVPTKSTFTIPEINRTESPEFIYRFLPFLEKNTDSIPAIHEWQNQQKLGFSFRLNHNHNWMETVPADLFKTHPDWFAMINGKRLPPEKAPQGRYKLETTNPELVRYFADKAIAALKENPEQNTYSLSPSDSRGYSESPESEALKEPNPNAIFDPESKAGAPSITPLILKFYRDVSAIVEKEYPQGKLAGYLYQDYLFPPQKGDKTLPENFIPMIAPSFDYGYKLYREDVREKFDYVMDGWSKVIPSKWFYYDLPNQIMSPYASGIITPPGNSILNFIFPRLLKNHIAGVDFYGNTSWSSSAMTNYIVAKMIWNPQLKADDLQREWLVRAYGAPAAAVMGNFYTKLDGWFSAFYNKYDYYSYHAREPLFSQLYAPHYAEMEQLILEAAAQPMTPQQEARFELLKSNLIVLRWRLVNAGYIKSDVPSPLKRDGAQIAKMMFDGSNPRQTADKAFDLFPVLWYQDQPKNAMFSVEKGLPPQTAQSKASNAGYIVIYADKGGKITITPQQVSSGSAFVGWTLYEPKNKNDFRVMQKGLFFQDGDITFDAKANSPYLLRITPQGFVSPKLNYTLNIPGAVVANGSLQNNVFYLGDKSAPVYVYVPKGLDVYADETNEGARLRTLMPPDAARAAELNKSPGAKVLLTLDTGWKFQIDPQNVGLAEKYFSPSFDHTTWKNLNATATWQDQGFPNYHGVAWYRKTFNLKTKPAGNVRLFFGAVDGDAVVYVNGEKVGEHALEKDGTGWDQPFSIDVTKAIKPKQNNITIQVTKNSNASGIFRGVSLIEG